MTLAKIRKNMPEYEALVSYIESRLTTHRLKLESTSVPVGDVPEYRARIAELKALLSQLNEEQANEHP